MRRFWRTPAARCHAARWCSAQASAIERWGRQCVRHAVSSRVLGDQDAGCGMGVRCGMSKPDAAGAKSLEEILASIRKSLSGDGGDASGGPRSGAPKQTQAAPEASPAAERTDDDDGLLSTRLAGALNGPVNGAAHDDDFADLLAPDSKK